MKNSVRVKLLPDAPAPYLTCAYCGGVSEGNYAIHRDGYGIGPEVPLCDNCGAYPWPDMCTIWAKISHTLRN